MSTECEGDGFDELEEQNPADYGSVQYWEAHFAQAPHGLCSDPAALEYEWISSDLASLAVMLVPHLPDAGRVLHPGAGMSLLPVLLHEALPELELLSIDASARCVQEMMALHSDEAERLIWRVGDVTADLASVAGQDCAGAVEKGCLDALLCHSDELAAAYVAALAECLATSAPYLLISN
eukprot:CAMPEP_0178440050 /NCGR_PEP_ID=MMETSP0689_2-20121128/36531_1 /TAXON_ID=160604 /ORGANISM="Amphidinium massartii, Strain CS-259" /LENGTH=179 /DNA_ID=CAMNT_0020062717 /DNA_START=73 /DNA_END=609 /DNA_ORIENTATION=-